jgi:hypothetical protein
MTLAHQGHAGSCNPEAGQQHVCTELRNRLPKAHEPWLHKRSWLEGPVQPGDVRWLVATLQNAQHLLAPAAPNTLTCMA